MTTSTTPPHPVPPPCTVPDFPVIRVRGGRHRLRRAVRRRRHTMAAGLAMTAAALAAAGPRDAGGHGTHPTVTREQPDRPSAKLVSAPVRISDEGTVRLIEPGDRVDVIAADAGKG